MSVIVSNKSQKVGGNELTFCAACFCCFQEKETENWGQFPTWSLDKKRVGEITYPSYFAGSDVSYLVTLINNWRRGVYYNISQGKACNNSQESNPLCFKHDNGSIQTILKSKPSGKGPENLHGKSEILFTRWNIRTWSRQFSLTCTKAWRRRHGKKIMRWKKGNEIGKRRNGTTGFLWPR